MVGCLNLSHHVCARSHHLFNCHASFVKCPVCACNYQFSIGYWLSKNGKEGKRLEEEKLGCDVRTHEQNDRVPHVNCQCFGCVSYKRETNISFGITDNCFQCYEWSTDVDIAIEGGVKETNLSLTTNHKWETIQRMIDIFMRIIANWEGQRIISIRLIDCLCCLCVRIIFRFFSFIFFSLNNFPSHINVFFCFICVSKSNNLRPSSSNVILLLLQVATANGLSFFRFFPNIVYFIDSVFDRVYIATNILPLTLYTLMRRWTMFML